MQRAEREMRDFYLAELKLNLRERWAMKDEDEAMRKLMKEEFEANKKSKVQDVAGAEPKLRKSRKAKKREELKAKVAEKQRIAREMEGMAQEDELSQQMRLDEIRKKQEEAMKNELAFGSDAESSSSEEEDDDEDYDEDNENDDEDNENDDGLGKLGDGIKEILGKESDESVPMALGMQFHDDAVREMKTMLITDRKMAVRSLRKLKKRKKKNKPVTSEDRDKLDNRMRVLRTTARMTIELQKGVLEAAYAELGVMQAQNQFSSAGNVS